MNFFDMIEDQYITQAYSAASSIVEFARLLGKTAIKRADYQLIKEKLESLDLSWEELSQKGKTQRQNRLGRRNYLNSEIFVENSTMHRGSVKKRILSQNLIPYVCKANNCAPTWFDRPLVLILDHINGVNNDNRLENLRFLCPNCNSQQDTFCGKNIKKSTTKIIPELGPIIEKRIAVHLQQPKTEKRVKEIKPEILWPTKEEMFNLIWSKPISVLAVEWGLSDRGIGKKCSRYGLQTPPRGFWTKFQFGASETELKEYCAKYGVLYPAIYTP